MTSRSQLGSIYSPVNQSQRRSWAQMALYKRVERTLPNCSSLDLNHSSLIDINKFCKNCGQKGLGGLHQGNRSTRYVFSNDMCCNLQENQLLNRK